MAQTGILVPDLRIPVLTYHSINILENSYTDNDHLALETDLEVLRGRGWKIHRLGDIVRWHRSQRADAAEAKVVALSCDDGSWFDFYDLDHPTCGMQRSFLNILRDFRDRALTPGESGVHMTSFVIASPGARTELDRKGLIGKSWWGDEWWPEAQATGLMEIACHSWDHVHPDLEWVAQRNQLKGDFTQVNSFEDCETQVRRAGDYMATRLGGNRPTLFAYPWGQASEYMVGEYMPKHRYRHGFAAAFTTEPKPLEKSDCVWALPRYVFGRDWRSPEELERLLADSG